jgi:hypothetical protein
MSLGFFLNNKNMAELQTLGVEDKTALIVSTKRVILKSNYSITINEKADKMIKKIKKFKYSFRNFFRKVFHLSGITLKP